MLPTRYRPTHAIRERYADRVDRLAAFLTEGDHLADAAVEALSQMQGPVRHSFVDTALARGIDTMPEAPEAMRAFFAAIEHVPYWFDRERGHRGGEVLLKAGPLGGAVLATRSLVAGYCSPAGNKPLTFSARLHYDVARRLAETARFVQTTAVRGGMARHAEGFRATVKVRLMHAQVRRMLAKSPKWDASAWGVPINQFDMVGTALLFSHVLTEGLQMLGYPVSREDAEDNLHLWRYIGWLMGVREELLPTSLEEARALWEQTCESQAAPDDDSRALAKAMIEHPLTMATTPKEIARAKRGVEFTYALSRHLIGDKYADALEYPKSPWRYSMRAIRTFVHGVESLRRGVPGSDGFAVRMGERYWADQVKLRIENASSVTFKMPDHLGADAHHVRAAASSR